MSEFDAYNSETDEWETHPVSRLTAVRRDKRYTAFAGMEED